MIDHLKLATFHLISASSLKGSELKVNEGENSEDDNNKLEGIEGESSKLEGSNSE